MKPSCLPSILFAPRTLYPPPPPSPSDRDFTDEDYEALLALDEGVENRRGASQEAINAIETVRVMGSGEGEEGGGAGADCSICLEGCQAGEILRRLACKHCFHQSCIDRWLRTKAVCPICQRVAA